MHCSCHGRVKDSEVVRMSIATMRVEHRTMWRLALVLSGISIALIIIGAAMMIVGY